MNLAPEQEFIRKIDCEMSAHSPVVLGNLGEKTDIPQNLVWGLELVRKTCSKKAGKNQVP